MQNNIFRSVIRLGPFQSAVRTVIDAKLSIVEEIIGQLFSAGAAEDTFPDLRARDVVKDLFADPVCHIRILTVLCQGIRKNIIAVKNQLCLRHT